MSARPLTRAGYWPHDSNINFCEPDYEMTHYVAEFWNTLSSLAMVLVGVSGICLTRWQKLGVEQLLCYLAVGIVGCGSFAFHATLMRTGQVADEIPMLWGTLTLIYGAVHHADERRNRVHGVARSSAASSSSSRLRILRGALLAYSLLAMALYFASGFGVFIALYGFSVVFLVLYATASIFSSNPPAGAEPRRLMISAAAAYGGGVVFLWLPSELLCDQLPLIQRLPLHAIFHLTSAAGPHLGLTAFALARFEHEHATAPASLLFAGLPAIDRGAALHKQV